MEPEHLDARRTDSGRSYLYAQQTLRLPQQPELTRYTSFSLSLLQHHFFYGQASGRGATLYLPKRPRRSVGRSSRCLPSRRDEPERGLNHLLLLNQAYSEKNGRVPFEIHEIKKSESRKNLRRQLPALRLFS